jgi:MoxR-like ATPase
MDRFLFKVKVGYGTPEEEQEVISRAVAFTEVPLTRVLDTETLLGMRDLSSKLHVADKVRRYIVQLVFATREPENYGLRDLKPLLHVGASPRASISLERAARVSAMLQGRTFVTPQDIKDVGLDVLRHRILPTYEAEAEGVTTDDIIRRIFARVDVP